MNKRSKCHIFNTRARNARSVSARSRSGTEIAEIAGSLVEDLIK